MNEKRYSLHEVTESLRISPDTLYRWEKQIPNLKPEQCEGGRYYTSWEFDLLQHAYRLYHNYNQDFAGTRSALERWISKNPKPMSVEEVEETPARDEPRSQEVDLDLNSIKKDLKDGAQSKAHFTLDQVSAVGTEPIIDLDEGVKKTLIIEDKEVDPFQNPSVIQQAGGKKRTIGRSSNEDLFSDLDSDPFDLSPSPRGRFKEFERIQSKYSLNGTPPTASSSLEHSPALAKLEQRYSSSNHSSWSGSPDTSKANLTPRAYPDRSPSASDWLEGSTVVDHEAVDERRAVTSLHSSRSENKSSTESTVSSYPPKKEFKPQRAFSDEVPVLKDSVTIGGRNSSEAQLEGNEQKDQILSDSMVGRFKAKAELKPIPAKRSIQTPYGSAKHKVTNVDDHNLKVAYQEALKMPEVSKSTGSLSMTSTHNKVVTEDIRSFKDQPLLSNSPKEFKDQESWQRAYNHTQAQLARAKGELARTQETVSQQKKEIKQLQGQLLSIKESVLKEIYDLRDLVVDN